MEQDKEADWPLKHPDERKKTLAQMQFLQSKDSMSTEPPLGMVQLQPTPTHKLRMESPGPLFEECSSMSPN